MCHLEHTSSSSTSEHHPRYLWHKSLAFSIVIASTGNKHHSRNSGSGSSFSNLQHRGPTDGGQDSTKKGSTQCYHHRIAETLHTANVCITRLPLGMTTSLVFIIRLVRQRRGSFQTHNWTSIGVFEQKSPSGLQPHAWSKRPASSASSATCAKPETSLTISLKCSTSRFPWKGSQIRQPTRIQKRRWHDHRYSIALSIAYPVARPVQTQGQQLGSCSAAVLSASYASPSGLTTWFRQAKHDPTFDDSLMHYYAINMS
jgi:hypothetical protein